MEQIIQITALCVVGAVLALVVKKGSPEAALLLTLAAAVTVLLFLGGAVEELMAFLDELAQGSGVSQSLFVPLYKTVGIALVVKVGSGLCRDAGESALSSVVETAGAVCALLVALPAMGQGLPPGLSQALREYFSTGALPGSGEGVRLIQCSTAAGKGLRPAVTARQLSLAGPGRQGTLPRATVIFCREALADGNFDAIFGGGLLFAL